MNGLSCPWCESDNLYVVDTHKIPNGIKRRRACADCRMRWYSYEYNEGTEQELSAKMDEVTREIQAARDAIREAVEKLQAIRI